MSDSNWGIRVAALSAVAALSIVSLGLGAFIGASHTPNYGYHSAETSHRRAKDSDQYPTQIDRDRAGLPDFAERIASGPDPSEGSEREKRDLAAQESMSVWAFWMLIVAGASAIITAFGTGFLLWQIMLTREAVKDTGDATKAMVRQNELTEANQRAWLVVEDVRLTSTRIIDFGDGPSIIITADYQVRNVGHSPALCVEHSASLQPSYWGKDCPKDMMRKLRQRSRAGGANTLPPRSTAHQKVNSSMLVEMPDNGVTHTLRVQIDIVVAYRLPKEGRVRTTYSTFNVMWVDPRDGQHAALDYATITKCKRGEVAENTGLIAGTSILT